jgi:carboxylesterase
MIVLPGAEPYAADRGPVGVVLSHGFTATPGSLRPWAEYLAAAACTVRLPRLPGHRTTWQDANTTRWQDWHGEIRQTYEQLRARRETIFAAGLSMGGTLVTRLAEKEGNGLAGLILVNPSFATERSDARFARYICRLIRSRPGFGSDIKAPHEDTLGYDRTPVRAFASLQRLWSVVRADLHRISAQRGAASTTVRELLLENSYHVATMDHDAPLIFEGSLAFIHEYADVVSRAS